MNQTPMTTEFDSVALEHEYPATACGIPDGDGLLVAYLPKLDGVMQESFLRDLVVYSMDGVVIDALPNVTHYAPDSHKGPVKWWRVRGAARELGLAQIEPIWQGPAGELKLSSLPDVPRPEPDYTLHMRAYSHGPWIRLEQKIG